MSAELNLGGSDAAVSSSTALETRPHVLSGPVSFPAAPSLWRPFLRSSELRFSSFASSYKRSQPYIKLQRFVLQKCVRYLGFHLGASLHLPSASLFSTSAGPLSQPQRPCVTRLDLLLVMPQTVL